MAEKIGWLSSERAEILNRVVHEYQRDWQRAMKENPDWIGKLDWNDPAGKHRAHSTASRIALALKKADALKKKTMGRPAKTEVAEDNRQLICSIIRKYTVNGSVGWSRAFGEHPEWKHQLGIKAGANDPMMKRLYPMGSYLLKRDPQFADLRKAPAPPAPAESNGEHGPAPAPVDPIKFCPSCGFNLHILRAAFTVALKHSTKGQGR